MFNKIFSLPLFFLSNITLLMKLAGVEISNKILLGPMAGVTTLAYREFMKPFGVGLSFSEMVSDCGIRYGNEKTLEYLKSSKLDTPYAIQLFGFSLENTIPAIKKIEEVAHYDFLDLNFGCPVEKVVKTGAGSKWLKDVAGLENYVREIVKASSKPVTAKIRLGWDEKSINVYEVSEALERAGVVLVSIHCRTREQFYSGKARYEEISEMRNHIKIPYAVSGDIFTPEDAKRALDITHADFVMVARGGLGHPYLLTQINQYLTNGVLLSSPGMEKQIEYAKEFAYALIKEKGEYIGVRELRGLLPHFFSSFPGYKRVRMQLATSLDSVLSLEKIFKGIEEREKIG